MTETKNTEAISATPYLVSRLNPSRSDSYYLHLKDLINALRPWCPKERVNVLDFGCGGPPYRSLFPNAEYIRADIPSDPELDFITQSDNTIAAPSANYDIVLSTQVLEHVEFPESYLKEAYRVLKPGGILLLSTHGWFEEHGCPYDFH